MKKLIYFLLITSLTTFSSLLPLSFAELTTEVQVRQPMTVEQFIGSYCFPSEDEEEVALLPITNIPAKNGSFIQCELTIEKCDDIIFHTPVARSCTREEQTGGKWQFTLQNSTDEILSGIISYNGKKAELFDVRADNFLTGETLVKIWTGICTFLGADCYLIDGAVTQDMLLRVIRPLCTTSNWYEKFGFVLIDKHMGRQKNSYFHDKAVNTIRSLLLSELLNTVQIHELENARFILQQAHDQVCTMQHSCDNCQMNFGQLLNQLYQLNNRHPDLKNIYMAFFNPYLAFWDSLQRGHFSYQVLDSGAALRLFESLKLLFWKNIRCKEFTSGFPAVNQQELMSAKSMHRNNLLHKQIGSALILANLSCTKISKAKDNNIEALRYLVLANSKDQQSLTLLHGLFFHPAIFTSKFREYPLFAKAFSLLTQHFGNDYCENALFSLLQQFPQIAVDYVTWIAATEIQSKNAIIVLYSYFGATVEDYLQKTNNIPLLLKLYTNGALWKPEWLDRSRDLIQKYRNQLSRQEYTILILAYYKAAVQHARSSQEKRKLFDAALGYFGQCASHKTLTIILDIFALIDFTTIESFGRFTQLFERISAQNDLGLSAQQWNIIAHVYLKEHNYSKAIAAFKNIVKDDPFGITVFEHLSKIYEQESNNPIIAKEIFDLCIVEFHERSTDTINAATLAMEIMATWNFIESEHNKWFDIAIGILGSSVA